MPKVNIKIAILGQLPRDFDQRELHNWKSSVFAVDPSIETYQLNEDSKGDDWEYTDAQLEEYLAKPFAEDFQIIIVNVKLQHNWYVRRLENNRLLFTFYEIAEILQFHNVPLHNLVLRLLYAATLIYRRYDDRIPLSTEETNYAHDETRGCLFDMNASKWDAVYSCDSPILCDHCVAALKTATVSNELIASIQNEIKEIRKPLFFRVIDFVKLHPIWSLVLSIGTAFVIGVLSSVSASLLFRVVGGASKVGG